MLLNGMRYNSFQNGLADLNLLPLQNIERVEAVSGGSSALYGADALSGVVNVITRKPTGDFHLRAAGGSGSFERSHVALEGSSAIGGFGVMAGYGMERGRDDYAFTTPVSPDSTLHREDADFFRQQLYLQGFGGLDEHTTLNAAIQDVRADRGSPGPYSPFTSADARLFDNIITSSAELSHSGGSDVSWNIATSYQYNYETFSDPDPIYPYETFYKNRTFTLNHCIAGSSRGAAGVRRLISQARISFAAAGSTPCVHARRCSLSLSSSHGNRV